MMVGEWTELTAADGHCLDMYAARPRGKPKGAIVVLQEIFGVNDHIRSVCDRLSEAGFVAGAPALFDRMRRSYQTGYDQKDVSQGMELMSRFDFGRAEVDISAAIDALKADGKVSILGFCLGGSLAYKMATMSSEIASASCYYGGRIADYADDAPRCPVLLHYGESDPSIPPENVETVRRKQPNLPLFVYPAGHGFNCDARAAFEPESAKLAWARTMSMFERVSAG